MTNKRIEIIDEETGEKSIVRIFNTGPGEMDIKVMNGECKERSETRALSNIVFAAMVDTFDGQNKVHIKITSSDYEVRATYNGVSAYESWTEEENGLECVSMGIQSETSFPEDLKIALENLYYESVMRELEEKGGQS